MDPLFLAFNDECDSARVNHIRKQLLASGRYQAAGLYAVNNLMPQIS